MLLDPGHAPAGGDAVDDDRDDDGEGDRRPQPPLLGEVRLPERVRQVVDRADPTHAEEGDDAALAPSPRLSDIATLAGTRPGGATVTVQVEGDDDSIPPPVAAAVFRLAQESVTNALRHARQITRVDVLIGVDANGVRLRVTNDGEASASPNAGFGIIGMMERAALLGGTCQAGAAPGGGWAVTAVLPRAGWAA